MIQVYKPGGQWKTKDGAPYTAKAINEADKVAFIEDGWVSDLSLLPKEATKPEKKVVKKAVRNGDNKE